MKRMLNILRIVILAMGMAVSEAAAIEIVAATPELADIARRVGGDKVSVYSIAKANWDYHLIEPRPSDVSRIARADMVVRVGMALDLWLDALLNAAGNTQVNRSGAGYIDCSLNIAKLQVPREQITGASGDVHVLGNPHYYYDPENGKIIARTILQGLKGLDSVSQEDKTLFENNYKQFASEIDSHMAAWQKTLAPYRGRVVVTYHQSAVYFMERFGLKQFATLEPKPGIAPSASHIGDLIQRMKNAKGVAMVVDSIYPTQFPDLVSRETGIKYTVIPYSIGALGTKNYFDLIDTMVNKYAEALR